MKKYLSIACLAIGMLGLSLISTGCLTSKVVTPSTNAAGVTTFTTNTVVNTAQLNIDCAALQLVGTPAVIYAIQKDPSARPIVVDIQVALQGALQGANTNVVSQINGLIGGNASLQASITPLIQGASSLEQQLLAKYGSIAGVQITQAILNADLNITTAALAAVPAN